MARKGNRKVRTGCLTCKIRKVKCDEGKPSCHRCVSTGRKCDGYAPSASAVSTLQWHRPRSHFPGVNSPAEIRHLQFFWEVAAPGMSGPTDPYFWTSLVLQFGSFEPAVRHSLIAISSLYERLLLHPRHTLKDDGVALAHYNAAIRATQAVDNAPLVLLVCVLFICVEFLRGDRARATQHCQHGARLLAAVAPAHPWAREHLAPLFRRLSLFPFFFGRGAASFAVAADPVPPAFAAGVVDAQCHADDLLRRAVRLLRRADPHRLGRDPLPRALLSERAEIRDMLRVWQAAFHALGPEQMAAARRDTVCNILMRYEIARMWTETALERSEMAFDAFVDRFRWLVDEAAKLAARDSNNNGRTPVFSFEMAFVPSLFFIAIKCRCLDTRLRALALLKRLGARRETLWEVPTVYATGKLIIELEHGVVLDEAGRMCTAPSCPGLPADEARVREITTDPELRTRVNPATGVEEFGKMLGLFMKTVEGEIYLRNEFIAETL
ncbi:hypothetical protein F4775DRAFT_476225 [Biscogniauxia sp. FL1348]|nr:hypothetical protein F4775DRAFT_476225 [Biscogniauxia sp. FL1348]